MISGPKPKPTALKRLGPKSHHVQNNDEPLPEHLSRVPPPPNWMGKEARAEWKELAGQLYESGVLTRVDLDALAHFCLIFGRWRNAERHISKEGEITTTPNGYPQQNPWLAIANKCIGQMASIGSEFGLSPSARTRVKANPPAEENKLERELFGSRIKVSRSKRKE